jgi:hypothetical protein
METLRGHYLKPRESAVKRQAEPSQAIDTDARSGAPLGAPGARRRPLPLYEHAFCGRIVGLTWKARGGGRSTFAGRDATGKHYAHATNISGRWTIYLTPWACGRPGGLATGPFEDAAEAMAAADQLVGAYLSGEDDHE